MATTNIEISFSKIFRENSLFTVSLIFCLFYQTYPMCSARSLIISRFERPAPILSSSWPTISSPFLQPWYPFFSSPFTSLVGASSLALFAALMLRSFRWWNLLRPRISNLPRAKQRRIFTFTFVASLIFGLTYLKVTRLIYMYRFIKLRRFSVSFTQA